MGGWDRPYFQWGSSLGGIISMIMAGVEPAIVAAAPVSGGGGLFEIGLRTSLSTARHPVWLRVMGPIIVATPSGGPDAESACMEGFPLAALRAARSERARADGIRVPAGLDARRGRRRGRDQRAERRGRVRRRRRERPLPPAAADERG
ncbi:MAG: hypothetical protein M5U28_15030 [Sandaracinaceae bacterium]|nr:hypothetical protein [Sandaracinaceae bacterium]